MFEPASVKNVAGAGQQRKYAASETGVGRCVVPGRELVIAMSNGSFPPAPSPEGQQLMVETEILPRLP
jgi:hypothetical protein